MIRALLIVLVLLLPFPIHAEDQPVQPEAHPLPTQSQLVDALNAVHGGCPGASNLPELLSELVPYWFGGGLKRDNFAMGCSWARVRFPANDHERFLLWLASEIEATVGSSWPSSYEANWNPAKLALVHLLGSGAARADVFASTASLLHNTDAYSVEVGLSILDEASKKIEDALETLQQDPDPDVAALARSVAGGTYQGPEDRGLGHGLDLQGSVYELLLQDQGIYSRFPDLTQLDPPTGERVVAEALLAIHPALEQHECKPLAAEHPAVAPWLHQFWTTEDPLLRAQAAAVLFNLVMPEGCH